MNRSAMVVGIVFSCACSSWRSQASLVPRSGPMTVEVWDADTAFVLRSARADGDTLAGFVRTPARDSSAHRVSMKDVDSIRVRRFDGTKTFLGTTATFAGLLGVAWLVDSGTDDFEF